MISATNRTNSSTLINYLLGAGYRSPALSKYVDKDDDSIRKPPRFAAVHVC